MKPILHWVDKDNPTAWQLKFEGSVNKQQTGKFNLNNIQQFPDRQRTVDNMDNKHKKLFIPTHGVLDSQINIQTNVIGVTWLASKLRDKIIYQKPVQAYMKNIKIIKSRIKTASKQKIKIAFISSFSRYLVKDTLHTKSTYLVHL